MLYPLYILDALSDPFQLLHMSRGHAALRNSVVRIKISSKIVGLMSERIFFHRHFQRDLIGFSRIAHVVVTTIDSSCLIGSFQNLAFDKRPHSTT